MSDLIDRQAVLEKQYRIDDSATLSTRDVVNVEDIEDMPSITPTESVIEDIKAEIRQKQWHIGVDSANAVIDIIDRHIGEVSKLTSASQTQEVTKPCSSCKYQSAQFNPCNGCEDGSEFISQPHKADSFLEAYMDMMQEPQIIESMPSASQPKDSELISRQAAIEAINKRLDKVPNDRPDVAFGLCIAAGVLHDMSDAVADHYRKLGEYYNKGVSK